MVNSYDRSLKGGILEVYCGPMWSGKTLSLIHRVDKLRYKNGAKFLFFKPATDTRDEQIKSRSTNVTYNCRFVSAKDPYEILNYVDDATRLIAIDEVQFFSKGIVEVIQQLLLRDKNVVVAGLDLDFRGELFGAMGMLLAMADEVHKQYAICQHPECNATATRTQRLVNGKPAHYDSPIILVGAQNEGYEPRCIKHHEVPGKPTEVPPEQQKLTELFVRS